MPAEHDAPMPAEVEGLRVLGFCDWYSPEASGGAERVAWQVYRRLGAAGAQLRVVSAAHGEPHRDPNVEVDVVKGYDLSRLAGGYLAPAPGAFRAARRAQQLLDPHVIHVNTIHYTGCLAGARLAARSGVPLVVTVHLGPLDHLPGRTRRLAAAFEKLLGRYILRRAARVLAVSESARAHAVVLGATSDKVSIAPNGVDHARFDVPPLVASEEPLVIAVGRLTSNKGPDLLLEAVGRLAGRHAFKVTFVGDGPMRPALEARSRELGLDRIVNFAGQVDDVPSRMAAAEVVVRASYTEGMALAVIEGMAAGRCNVVSDIPPNLELVTDRRNGLTFRVGDAADLARALGDALEDGALREQLGRQAREDSARYSWDNMAALHAHAMVACVGPEGTAGG